MAIIRATILRFALGDCTNGGISSKADTLRVWDGKGPTPGPGEADARLELRHLFGSEPEGYWTIYPMTARATGRTGWMMGGNYATAYQSMGWPIAYPIAIHDRSEG